MPRTNIAVNTRAATGGPLVWTTADIVNNMAVPNWSSGMVLLYRNLDGAATHAFTVVQLPCPTCGIETDRVITAAIAEPGAEIANLPPTLYTQLDGALYINPSSTQLRLAALLPS